MFFRNRYPLNQISRTVVAEITTPPNTTVPPGVHSAIDRTGRISIHHLFLRLKPSPGLSPLGLPKEISHVGTEMILANNVNLRDETPDLDGGRFGEQAIVQESVSRTCSRHDEGTLV